METNVLKVGIREFRAHLQQYILASALIAVTRHGETVGFYVPAHPHPKKAELEALKKAALQLEAMLISQGVNEDDLLSEFRALRKKQKK